MINGGHKRRFFKRSWNKKKEFLAWMWRRCGGIFLISNTERDLKNYMLLNRCLQQNWGSVKMPQSLSPIKQIAVLSFTRAGRLTGLNYDGGVKERHITSSLHFSWIHFTVVDLNMTERRHTHTKNCRQLTDNWRAGQGTDRWQAAWLRGESCRKCETCRCISVHVGGNIWPERPSLGYFSL